MTKKIKKIVCLGDSLTYGFGVKHNDTWIALATGRLGCEIVNAGINGDTTGGMLARLRGDVFDAGADVVVITGGANDIVTSGTAHAAQSNVAAMVQQSATCGVRPLVGIPVPFDLPSLRPDWSRLTNFQEASEIDREYTQWLRLFCSVFRVPTVDFWSAFENHCARGALYLDGLHPTPEGHRLMAGVFCRVIEELSL